MTTPEVILGNSNRRFSGVTSTMLQTLPGVSERIPLAVLGAHNLPEGTPILSYPAFLRLCSETLPDGSPRVFHARRNDEMIQALLAKRLFGARIAIVFTTTAQRQHTGFTRWLMGQMDGLLTTCAAAGSYVDHEIDEVIPHGVDLECYSPTANREKAWSELGLPGKYGIGIFGRVRPQKGIDVLVEAAIPVLRENPDPTVVIVGETTPKFAGFRLGLEEKIAAAGLESRIIFHGKRPGSELPGLFQGMSLVAALSRNEGFGLTVLEAMASGCAVLASQAGAWPEIITEGTHGFTVPCGDIETTHARLAELTASPEGLAAMGRAGRKHAEENYSVAREVEALCAYYRRWTKS